MLRALSTAATGMQAQEMRVDIIANNLANVNTAGFKKSRGEFQDLLYENMRPAGAETGKGGQVPTGTEVGMGVGAVATQRQHTIGDFKETGNALDLAIEGEGFFQIRQANGEIAYTRDGSFKTDAQGRLVTSSGLLVEPSLVLPEDTQQLSIDGRGKVMVARAGSNELVEVGEITLATFANPAGLQSAGQNLLLATPAAGQPIIGPAGSEGIGTIASGYIELSNVRVVEEMVDLITSQRAYETNSKVVRAADEMLQATSNLR